MSENRLVAKEKVEICLEHILILMRNILKKMHGFRCSILPSVPVQSLFHVQFLRVSFVTTVLTPDRPSPKSWFWREFSGLKIAKHFIPYRHLSEHTRIA